MSVYKRFTDLYPNPCRVCIFHPHPTPNPLRQIIKKKKKNSNQSEPSGAEHARGLQICNSGEQRKQFFAETAVTFSPNSASSTPSVGTVQLSSVDPSSLGAVPSVSVNSLVTSAGYTRYCSKRIGVQNAVCSSSKQSSVVVSEEKITKKKKTTTQERNLAFLFFFAD